MLLLTRSVFYLLIEPLPGLSHLRRACEHMIRQPGLWI